MLKSQFVVIKLETDKEDFQISFVVYNSKQSSDMFVLVMYIPYNIDPLSEGLVTPPLGVEKLSPRFDFFDNMFSCIT